MSPTLSKDVSSFHSSYRSAKRQAPAGAALLRGLDVYGRLILLPVAAEEFFKTHGGLLQRNEVGQVDDAEMIRLAPVEARTGGDEDLLFLQKIERHLLVAVDNEFLRVHLR